MVQKWFKNGSKMVQKWSKMIKNDPKMIKKMAKKMVLKCPQVVKRG